MILAALVPSQAGALAVENAIRQIDASGVNRSVVANDSHAYKIIDSAANASVVQNPFLQSLSGLVSKLDLFVQIVDKTASVRLSFVT